MKTTQMNPIYLDIGNSSYKLTTKNKESNWNPLFKGSIHEFDRLVEYLNRWGQSKRLVYTSVRLDFTKKLEAELRHLQLHQIHTGLIPPIYLDYDTPDTLGMDRFLACSGAVRHAEGSSVIVIDSGTACTIDYMTAKGVFKGGVIMPGVRTVKKAMHDSLPELPEASDADTLHFPGKSTLECINIGVYGGFSAMICEFVNRFKRIDQGARIYITGGDASLVRRLIGTELSIEEREYLLFDGLEALVRDLSKTE